ncbi:inner membrane protein YpjD [Salmonella enterica]|uniref:cytochrome C assembly family protein n=1 Tax=Salmonella enterica TaxID=28901 RepID=UPI000FA3E4D2|nr:inner membrane protein YpjD [Salmonella enterica]EEA7030587.1 inner membrane protein YpjD [Salmonella enterica subsp. enterica serovar Enteritidis]EAA6115708.1 inner membrane protein YpjD [Salmonella enterica subsp. enterica serovar Tennessee]EEU8398269.1 inner membrane protein YpjD [Salmonella enterica]EEU8401382.1 inner membrane protein YpjD [Salmonella enterica]EEU8565561.1 inner membrane protein YpjD [Salmonella enterica]
MPVFALLALVAYSFSLALIVPGLLQKNSGWRRMAILSAVIALVCHAVALESRILPGGDSGQNLSLLNVGSLVSLMICTVMTIVASRNRGWLLLPIVYAFALINLAFATFMPNEYITHLEATPGMMVHIGLSLFSYATLIIAALYALQLAWIDYQLKNKKLAFSNEMPPLISIERKMFHITQIGVVLLTLTLCTGLFYMHNLFSTENIDKAVLSIVAWFVYIVLLWGHYHEGWRGRRVVWFNVAGAGILTLAYFGSRILQQFVS